MIFVMAALPISVMMDLSSKLLPFAEPTTAVDVRLRVDSMAACDGD